MNKIRKGDEVIVLSGQDKKQRGIVLGFSGTQYVLVEGINLVKKNVKGNPAKNIQGGIVEKAMPIHISNVSVFNSSISKSDRIGFKGKNSDKVRIFRSNNAAVDIKV